MEQPFDLHPTKRPCEDGQLCMFKCPECQSLVDRLRIRASIRRQIKDRKSVQEGKPDRIADLLEEAADEIEKLELINLAEIPKIYARIEEIENKLKPIDKIK